MEVAKSEGKTGNRSPKPDGARIQAVLLNLEISQVVVYMDNLLEARRESRQCRSAGRQKQLHVMASEEATTGVEEQGMYLKG